MKKKADKRPKWAPKGETRQLRLRFLPMIDREALALYARVHDLGGIEEAIYHLIETSHEINKHKAYIKNDKRRTAVHNKAREQGLI